MRTWTAALVSTLILASASNAFASKKAAKNDFGDLFSAVDNASAKPAKHHARTPAAKAKPASKSVAHAAAKAPGTLVAQANPQPVDANVLVLMDYAPDRHAWAGP